MRDEIIEDYFNLGLTAPEIALFLVSVHGIGISLRQLKRIFRRLGCTRRRRRSNLNEVVFLGNATWPAVSRGPAR